MKTYRIRGYSDSNPDFSFTVEADIMPFGVALRDIVSDALHRTHLDVWQENVDSDDIDWEYELGDDEERSDLRDTDSQRVWVITSIYCNLDQDISNTTHRCGEDGDGQGDDSDCENDTFMITIDVEGE